jgi:phage gpG-like protein
VSDVAIEIELFGDIAFRHVIENLADRADNMSPAFRQIREQWIHAFEQQFGTEGRRSGNPWKQLSIATASKRGSAHPILFDRGNLFDDIIDENAFFVQDDGITFVGSGYAREIGGYHQSGTSRMPRRPIVDLTLADERESIRIIDEHLVPPRTRLRDARGRFMKRPL